MRSTRSDPVGIGASIQNASVESSCRSDSSPVYAIRVLDLFPRTGSLVPLKSRQMVVLRTVWCQYSPFTLFRRIEYDSIRSAEPADLRRAGAQRLLQRLLVAMVDVAIRAAEHAVA